MSRPLNILLKPTQARSVHNSSKVSAYKRTKGRLPRYYQLYEFYNPLTLDWKNDFNSTEAIFANLHWTLDELAGVPDIIGFLLELENVEELVAIPGWERLGQVFQMAPNILGWERLMPLFHAAVSSIVENFLAFHKAATQADREEAGASGGIDISGANLGSHLGR